MHLPEPVAADGASVEISHNLGAASTFIKYDEEARTFSLKGNSETLLADFHGQIITLEVVLEDEYGRQNVYRFDLIIGEEGTIDLALVK